MKDLTLYSNVHFYDVMSINDLLNIFPNLQILFIEQNTNIANYTKFPVKIENVFDLDFDRLKQTDYNAVIQILKNNEHIKNFKFSNQNKETQMFLEYLSSTGEQKILNKFKRTNYFNKLDY